MAQSQIGDFPNCHQSVYKQYLTEANAEIHRQPLGRASGNLLKKGRRDSTSQVGQGLDRETHRDSLPEFVGTHQLWNRVCMEPTYILYLYVTFVSLGLFVRLAVGSGPITRSWAAFGGLGFLAGLTGLALMQREKLGAISMWMSCFVDTHGRPSPFWMETWSTSGGECHRRRQGEEKGGRRDCGLCVK